MRRVEGVCGHERAYGVVKKKIDRQATKRVRYDMEKWGKGQ